MKHHLSTKAVRSSPIELFNKPSLAINHDSISLQLVTGSLPHRSVYSSQEKEGGQAKFLESNVCDREEEIVIGPGYLESI